MLVGALVVGSLSDQPPMPTDSWPTYLQRHFSGRRFSPLTKIDAGNNSGLLSTAGNPIFTGAPGNAITALNANRCGMRFCFPGSAHRRRRGNWKGCSIWFSTRATRSTRSPCTRSRNFYQGLRPIQLPGGLYSQTQTSRPPPRATAQPTSFVSFQTTCV